ncbi:unnamed protein product [Brachionus calyciflorus]|uniref:Uncharacterized protein n=1 Tax=Brachionus calyciflorus TaxID=104777 RepID=A0A813RXM8_9BILA|nr:unnamed protein product [Brachionus calyciflorus]
MKIFCELFHRVINNSNSFNGACFKYVNSSSIKISQKIFTNYTDSMNQKSAGNDLEAALFVIVVICFYSLSIVFIVIFNVKFDAVIDRDSKGSCYCWETNGNDLYEAQRDETKNTINMIFSDSSKLLTSVAIPSAVVEHVVDLTRKQDHILFSV